jgi:flavin reductase (DIM6/NTAB) family NADH-FMN oxidoreductase RutF
MPRRSPPKTAQFRYRNRRQARQSSPGFSLHEKPFCAEDEVKCALTMDPKTRQKTLRLLTNGMYVLTSRGSDGNLGAATVTWVSQASFKPPLLMVAVRKDSNVFRCLRESRVAALHVLGAGQRDIAQKFFAPSKGSRTKLNDEPFFEGKTSAPILKNSSAYLECKALDIREEYGDHAIVILEVVEAELAAPIVPLTVSDSPWEYGG